MLVGEIVLWAGELSQVNRNRLHKLGFLPCDGSFVSEKQYHDLWDVVQDNFRRKDAQPRPGHFQLPDFKGRAPIGVGNAGGAERGLGEYVGVEKVTLSIDEMPKHNHDHPNLETCQMQINENMHPAITVGGRDPNYRARPITLDTGGGQPHENMQPSLALHFLIRYKISRKFAAMLELDAEDVPQ